MRPNRPRRPFRPRCLALGMVIAWIVALYFPSFILAATGAVSTLDGILAATWALADRVGLPAKAMLALLTAALLLAARRLPLGPRLRLAADGLLGAVAMFLLIALLPAAWSDGIGVGLTGRRFDPATLPAYLAGGLLAGLAYSYADRKCGELKGSR